jgi:hypothetical protein
MSDPQGTPPIHDPWGCPTTPLTPPAPGLDAWGRPLDVFDPAANLGVLKRAAAQLRVWLGVFMGAQVLGGVVIALATFFGGRWGLGALETATPGLNLPGFTSWLLGLAAALMLVLAFLYVLVAGWARELITRLAAWALAGSSSPAPSSPAPDAARTEQLRRTLGGWLSFGQWGTAAAALLSAVFSVVAVVLGQGQLQQTLQQLPQDPATDLSTLNSLNSGFLVFQVLSGLVGSVPGVVITWLILGAIRRFMNLAVERLTLASASPETPAAPVTAAPVTPAAKVVGNWFLGSLILVGLGALQLLVVLIISLVASSFILQTLAADIPEAWSGLLGLLPWLIGVFLLYALAVYVLYFVLLLASRNYALSLARLLDLHNPAPSAAAPLPTAPIMDAPNIYKGPAL